MDRTAWIDFITEQKARIGLICLYFWPSISYNIHNEDEDFVLLEIGWWVTVFLFTCLKMLFLFLFTFTWYVGTRERNDTLNVVNDAPSLLFVSQGVIKMTKGLFLFSVCRSDNGGSFSQNYFALPTFTFWSVLLKKAAFCRRLNMDAAWDNVAVTSLDFTVWDFSNV